MNLNQLKTKVEQERGKFSQLQQEREKTLKELFKFEQEQEWIEQARVLIQNGAQITQAQLEYFISDLVSVALEAVLDFPYTFKTEFVLKRGKTECELFFERNGHRIKPLEASGGGVIDVASFALRMSLWSLNKNRPVIILDEPFKHLSKSLHGKAVRMLKEISEKLNVQIIMISHSEDLIEGADKVIELKSVKGVAHKEENYL